MDTMVRTGRPKKAGVVLVVKEETKKVEKERETIICPDCNGSKIQELHHGLVQRKCPRCGGSGRIVEGN